MDTTICHLAELEGETLYLYGRGSLDAFDRNWGQQATNTVTNIVFKFIDFDEIVSHLGKVQIKFPIVQVRSVSNGSVYIILLTHHVIVKNGVWYRSACNTMV